MKRPRLLNIGQKLVRAIPEGLPILINPEFKGSFHFPWPFPVAPKKRDKPSLFLSDNNGNILNNFPGVKTRKNPKNQF